MLPVGFAVAALLVQPPPGPDVAAAPNPESDVLAVIPGDWRIVDSSSGKVAQDCDRPQRFAVSADGTEIVLTEPWANYTARYRIIRREGARALTIIDGEKRLTDQGDPILWWFYVEDANHFRFRRYDWTRETATISQWQRCPKP